MPPSRRRPAAATPSIGAYLIDALRRRGVNHVFGVPGDFILGLYVIGAGRGMTMVNSTREEAATYAADGDAREKGLGAVAMTHGVGILATMAAPGGTSVEGMPVVVIGGARGPRADRDGALTPTDTVPSAASPTAPSTTTPAQTTRPWARLSAARESRSQRPASRTTPRHNPGSVRPHSGHTGDRR